MYKGIIYCLLIIGQLVIYKCYGKRYYKINRCITKNNELNDFVQSFNKKKVIAVRNQNKIPAPKPNGILMKYIYEDDPNDYFSYEIFESSNNTNTCIIIVPFMCGHSKSKPSRRLINRLQQLDMNIYCICSRSTLSGPINKNQKKYRGRISYDDVNALCLHVKEENIILIGQSLGSQQIFMMYKNNAPCLPKIRLLVLMHTYFDVRKFLHVPKWILQRLSTALMKQVEIQREFYLTHGYTEDDVNRVLNGGTLVHHDCIFDIRHLACKNVYTPKEYCLYVSLLTHLHLLNCPTLFIAVDDDIPCRKIPIQEVKQNLDKVSIVIINQGGHLGTVTQDGHDVTGLVALEYIQLAIKHGIISD